ncbi:LD-carboxypeptidase [Synechococcus sp. M16CYN]|uniref:S66 peptidase family protein n=1 Tax=Synechococcus sp. M16CYN TaxID=3103139 RepID=UPI00324B720D
MLPLRPAVPLRTGDGVTCVATSSALETGEHLNQGIAILENWGLRVHPHDLIGRRWGCLAGSDCDRRADLEPKLDTALLACALGGWGAARLLDTPIAWKPGWLLGFSDITALLWARLTAGFAGGVHGPLLTTLSNEPEWSQERLRKLLFGESIPNLQGRPAGTGQASGPLVAANLTVATHLIGTAHIPNLSNTILIFEDVGEAPYRVDRMLTQWRLSGILHKLAGIGFGSFENCDNATHPNSLHLGIEQVLEERTADLGIPRVFDLPIGHRCGNAALPLGAIARLDGQNGYLILPT